MMCDQRIRDGALICTQTGDHRTHVYHASWCADRHDVERGEDE